MLSLTKDCSTEFLNIKEDSEGWRFEGYASTFGNVDLTEDRIRQGAFAKTLKERGDKVKVLDQHNPYAPIGKPVKMFEDDQGLFTDSHISKTQRGQDVMTLIRDTVIDALSIGYRVIKNEYDSDTGIDDLIELKLYEYSPVTFPANELAVITAAKSQGFPPEYLQVLEKLAVVLGRFKSVVPFQNYSLAPQARRWQASAAEKRIRKWADAEDAPNAKYRKAFVWYDKENSDSFGAYKLLISDVIDGQVKAVPRAVFAAAGAVQGARGGLNVPASDLPGIRSHLSKYYKKMRSEFDDDGIVAPWDKSLGEVDLMDPALDDLKSLLGLDSPLGILDQTKRALEKAQSSLELLVKASEPDESTPPNEEEPDDPTLDKDQDPVVEIDPAMLQSVLTKAESITSR